MDEEELEAKNRRFIVDGILYEHPYLLMWYDGPRIGSAAGPSACRMMIDIHEDDEGGGRAWMYFSQRPDKEDPALKYEMAAFNARVEDWEIL